MIKKVVFGPSPSNDAGGNVGGTTPSPGSVGTAGGGGGGGGGEPTSVSTEVQALQQFNQQLQQLQQRHAEELESTRQSARQEAFGMLMSRMKNFDGQDPEQQQRLLSLTITDDTRKEWESLLGNEWEIINILQGKIQLDAIVKSELQTNMDKNEELFAQAFVLQRQFVESTIETHEKEVAQLTAQQQQMEADYLEQKKYDERVALANAEELQRLQLEVISTTLC